LRLFSDEIRPDLPVPILVENEHLQIWQLLTALLAFFGVKKQPFTHCFCSELRCHLHIVSVMQRKPRNILNASLFVNIWVAVIGSFLIIDARMGRVMKRGVLQNTESRLHAHSTILNLP
jgi:hypothetical protein